MMMMDDNYIYLMLVAVLMAISALSGFKFRIQDLHDRIQRTAEWPGVSVFIHHTLLFVCQVSQTYCSTCTCCNLPSTSRTGPPTCSSAPLKRTACLPYRTCGACDGCCGSPAPSWTAARRSSDRCWDGPAGNGTCVTRKYNLLILCILPSRNCVVMSSYSFNSISFLFTHKKKQRCI